MNVAVAGGNLANGPLNLTITVIGSVPRGQGLRRGGARPGDQIFVSGRLGEAQLGLTRAREYREPDLEPLLRAAPGSPLHPIRRYFLPTPRLELGQRLRGIATAAIDLSDGLLADLGQICSASGIGARLELAQLPLGAGVVVEGAFSGDDYELCFTVPGSRTADVVALSEELRMDLTLIGTTVEDEGITCVDAAGKPSAVEPHGFRHFR